MQCPNCKFYKVEETSNNVVVGKEPDPSIADTIVGIIIAAVIWGVGTVILAVFSLIPAFAHALGIIETLWTIGCIVGCIIAVRGALTQTRPVYGTPYTTYECKHCGYAWRN